MSPRSIRRLARAVLASVVVTAVTLAGAGTAASAVALPMVLSSYYGPSGGGGTIVGSVTPNPALSAPFPPGTTPVVQFQYFGSGVTGCSPMAKARTQIAGTGSTTTAGVLTVDPVAVKRVTSWKLAFQVPSTSYPGDAINASGLVLVGSQTQAKWNVCVYDRDATTSGTLLATAVYTLALKPTITSISPASSPAGGGQTVTVTGTGFTAGATAITGAIGGVPLTNIKVAANGNSFTATTGARAAATGLPLTVTAPGGTVSSLDPDNNPGTDNPIPFDYTNAITISPNTGPRGSMVTVDVVGAGFSQLSFDIGVTPTSSNAHVFLVDGKYDPASNRGVAECVVGMVVSDTELLCDLDLSGNPVPDGAYILTVVANGSTGAGGAANPSIISSGAAFVVGPY